MLQLVISSSSLNIRPSCWQDYKFNTFLWEDPKQEIYNERKLIHPSNHRQFIVVFKWNLLGIFVYLPSLSGLIAENNIRWFYNGTKGKKDNHFTEVSSSIIRPLKSNQKSKRRKPKCPAKDFWELSREPTNSIRTWNWICNQTKDKTVEWRELSPLPNCAPFLMMFT